MKDKNDIEICCENCRYGKSSCDWCWYDADGTDNFVPKQEILDKLKEMK